MIPATTSFAQGLASENISMTNEVPSYEPRPSLPLLSHDGVIIKDFSIESLTPSVRNAQASHQHRRDLVIVGPAKHASGL